MVVDVLYEGLELAKAAEAREQDGGLFVALAAPMPVGTRLVLRSASGDQVVRVERVSEVPASSGVLVKQVQGTVAAGAPTAAGATPEADEPDDAAPEGEITDGGSKKRGARKRKNTKPAERH